MKSRFVALALLIVSITCSANSARNRVIDYMALYYAAQAGDEQLVEELLARGAPVDAPDVNSAGMLSYRAVEMNSPLQMAAQNGHAKVVHMLLERKPWVDHRCCLGPAALGLAAMGGHTEVVDMLLKAGADPTIRSEYDDPTHLQTPLEAARAHGSTEMVRLLEAATANATREKGPTSSPGEPKPRAE